MQRQKEHNARFTVNQIVALPDGLEIRQPFMLPRNMGPQRPANVTQRRHNTGVPAEGLNGRHVLITGLAPKELGMSVPLQDLFLYSAALVTRQRGLWLPDRTQNTLEIEGTLLKTARLVTTAKSQLIPARAPAHRHVKHKRALG